MYAAASLGAAAASGYAPFLAARAVQGAANAFTTPLVLVSLAEATPEASLGRAMGTFAAVQTAGVVTAPLIGGLAGAVDYRLAFLASAAAAVLLALVPLPRRRRRADAPARLRDAATPRARWTAAAAFAAYFAVTGLSVVVALRAGDDLGLGPTARGLLLAGFGMAGVVVGRAAGAAADRHGAVAVAVAGALPCVVLLPLLGLAGSWPALAARWLGVGICSALVWAGLNILTVQSATANRGGAVSLVGAFKFAGNALAPARGLHGSRGRERRHRAGLPPRRARRDRVIAGRGSGPAASSPPWGRRRRSSECSPGSWAWARRCPTSWTPSAGRPARIAAPGSSGPCSRSSSA